MQEFNIFLHILLKVLLEHFVCDVQLLTVFPVCSLISCNAHCGTVMEGGKKPLLLLRRLGERVGCYLYNCFAKLNPGYFTVEAGVFDALVAKQLAPLATGVCIIHIGLFIR